jgi:DNA-nicking Smr family endonuclease
MYTIIDNQTGKYQCRVEIQDGIETWEKDDLEKAFQSVIKAARVLNGDYINQKDITFLSEDRPQIKSQDSILLDKIKYGEKVVLDFNDYRLKYRITEKECEMIQKIREGELTIINKK